MKLYAFQPQGHGPLSFYIIAESEEDARAKISEHILNHHTKDGKRTYNAEGFYKVTVAEIGEVLEAD